MKARHICRGIYVGSYENRPRKDGLTRTRYFISYPDRHKRHFTVVSRENDLSPREPVGQLMGPTVLEAMAIQNADKRFRLREKKDRHLGLLEHLGKHDS